MVSSRSRRFVASVDDWLRGLAQGVDDRDASFGLTTSFHPTQRIGDPFTDSMDRA